MNSNIYFYYRDMKSAIIINSQLLLAKAKYFVVKTEPHNEGALATTLLEMIVSDNKLVIRDDGSGYNTMLYKIFGTK